MAKKAKLSPWAKAVAASKRLNAAEAKKAAAEAKKAEK